MVQQLFSALILTQADRLNIEEINDRYQVQGNRYGMILQHLGVLTCSSPFAIHQGMIVRYRCLFMYVKVAFNSNRII